MESERWSWDRRVWESSGGGTGIHWRWDKTVRTGEQGPKTGDQELGQDNWESSDQRVRRVGTRSWDQKSCESWDQRVRRVGTRSWDQRELGPESWDRKKFRPESWDQRIGIRSWDGNPLEMGQDS